jgi:hypothetical protein
MFVFGLALANQQTILFLVPAFLVLAWRGFTRLPRSAGPLRLSPRELGIAVASLVAGLLPYLYLPLSASTDPPMNFGDPDTLGRFYTDVTRGSYGSTSLTVSGERGSVSEQMRLLFGSLVHGFAFVGILLALIGLWWAWRARRAEGIALATAFLFAGPIFEGYADSAFPDPVSKSIVARFYILPSIPVAISAGLGAWWLLTRADRLRLPARPGFAAVVAAGLLTVPVAVAAARYSSEDQSGNSVQIGYAKDTLRSLAPNSLLLLGLDQNYTGVSYAQVVDHFRTDVIAIDPELLKLPAYVRQLQRAHPDLLIPFSSYDGGVNTSLNDLVSANLAQRPVYAIDVAAPKFGKPFDLVYEGLVDRLVPKGQSPDPYQDLAAHPALVTGLHFPSTSFPSSSWESEIASDYGFAAFTLGYALEQDGGAGTVALSERMYRTAIRLQPTLAAAYQDLGIVLNANGGDKSEIVALWQRFLQLAPNSK